jgi:steroid 5-alpha reductase family enzyme
MKKTFDLSRIVFVYMAAGAVAWLLVRRYAHLHPYLVVGLADAAATLFVFLFSMLFNNSSVYDPYWSASPVPIALFYLIVVRPAEAGIGPREIVILALITIWGARLTWNWIRRWEGMKHEDWRYANFRRRFGNLYWLVSFSGIHFLPTIVVYLGCLAMLPALGVAGTPRILLDSAGYIVVLAAIGLETVSDGQMRRFLMRPGQEGKVFDKGLWGLMRHPNYLGEILFWWGMWLFAISTAPGWWWTVVGPVAMTALFIFASIPMIEKRMIQRRAGYESYRENVLLTPNSASRYFRKIVPNPASAAMAAVTANEP